MICDRRDGTHRDSGYLKYRGCYEYDPEHGCYAPFISYGGTSVMFLMLEMGMVLSVSNQIKLEQ